MRAQEKKRARQPTGNPAVRALSGIDDLDPLA
jgi:hypothetical protein